MSTSPASACRCCSCTIATTPASPRPSAAPRPCVRASPARRGSRSSASPAATLRARARATPSRRTASSASSARPCRPWSPGWRSARKKDRENAMDYVLPLLGIALANLLAAMSPGPSVLLVARIAIAGSRRAGLAAAAGMALGGMIWATATIFGLALLFSELAWLYRAMQVLGGLYLVYIAVMIWRGARTPIEVQAGEVRALTPRRAFVTALLSYLANPKVVVFFGSVFIALLPAHAPGWVWAATVAII